jgi:glycosyltransferase involved in cell wall biosynthesis
MSRRPRLVRVITRLNVGGPARQALLLSRELATDFDTVLVAGYPAPSEGELADPTVPVRRVPLVRPLRPWTDARAFVAVRRILSERPCDIVHTHMAKAGTVARLAVRTVGSRPRRVHTFHGHVLDGYFSPAVGRAFIEAERRLARRTDVIVAVSPEIRDELLDLKIGTPRQYVVVPLGLDIDAFLAVREPSGKLRSHLGLAPDVFLVGAVGRLVAIKDNTTLPEAVAHVPDVHLALVGDGDQRPQLEAKVRTLGIGDRVHFTGWWDDVPAAMSDLDVVALTSRNEGTPVSLIEALACGRPVVATDVGGVRFVVEDGVNGLVVPPGDSRRVAEAIATLAADRSLRSRLEGAGRAHVRERFGKDRLLTDIRDLYQELLGSPRAVRQP